MESTAALIPFDRLFKFSVSELTEEYRVNLFKKFKEENAELLGMFDEEGDKLKGCESEAEAEGEDSGRDEKDDVKEDFEDKEEEENEEESGSGEDCSSKLIGKSCGKSSIAKKSKRNKKVSRKMKELEYDYDDPFIDDSEITDVYQSVFELMRGGGIGCDGDQEGESEEDFDKERRNCESSKVKTKERNFFVYRGTMTPEILSKEFEIDVEELLEGEGGDASDEELEGEEENKIKKESKKRKTSSSGTATAVKKTKTAKQPAAVKEPKKAKEPKEPKEGKKKKPSDLIAQSAKKFNDLFSNEDANEKITSVAAVPPVFNVNGVDSNLLELREVLKRFRDSAVGTPFSPGKFPSSLRPRLNESICAVLRVSRPAPTALFPAKLFPALASFLPFSPAALNKLLTKKILGPLMEGIEKSELPKMYEIWRKMIDNRIIEGGFVEVPCVNNANNVGCGNDAIEINQVEVNIEIQTPSTPVASSPVKKRLKFSEEMRQQVFDIVRMEIDLNNLFCLSNFIESSNAAASGENVSMTLRSVQSELNLRKIVYQKLMNLSTETVSETGGVPLLSTTEISKEFGAQKRKHEKKASRAASEIIFGEVEIEELLKELDIRKEAQVQVQQAEQAQLPMDPLNLFDNEAPTHVAATVNNDDKSNTSLFIESNQ
jgi:hypothetical protein